MQNVSGRTKIAGESCGEWCDYLRSGHISFREPCDSKKKCIADVSICNVYHNHSQIWLQGLNVVAAIINVAMIATRSLEIV